MNEETKRYKIMIVKALTHKTEELKRRQRPECHEEGEKDSPTLQDLHLRQPRTGGSDRQEKEVTL